MLEAEGLVATTAQRGFRVTLATKDDLCDTLMVRGELEKLALTWATSRGDVAWEGRVIAMHHTLRKSEDAVAAGADDLVVLERDEARRAFSEVLISTCESPRLIKIQARLFNQSRRFRMALLREGWLDFASRRERQRKLLDAVLERDTDTGLAVLAEDVEAEMKL